MIWNTGVGFGLLSTIQFRFIILLQLNYFSNSNFDLYVVISKSLDKYIYSVIIGGAFGNYYDRLSYNAVPDFIDLHYKIFTGLHLMWQIYL